MPTPQLAKQLHPLCHEHHIVMRMTKIFMKMEGRGAQTSAYRCSEADCPVRYSVSHGYFLCATGEQVEMGITPHVRCPRDAQPMYLAETNPEKRAFRLWRCPQCDSSHTNEEGLISNNP